MSRSINVLTPSLVFFLLLFVLNLPAAQATEYSSANFKILDPVIVPGAGFSTSSGFQLWSSLGQPSIGISDSGSFGLKGGFLYFPAPAPPPPPPPPPPPAGGGGGGGGVSLPSEVTIILSGRAYPKSAVVILVDGAVKETVLADTGAGFNSAFKTIPGLRSFGVYATDAKGRRSLTFTFSQNVPSGGSLTISDIFLAPTLDIDKSEVRRGEPLAIFGQTVPSSEVTIVVNSEDEIKEKVLAGPDGVYFTNFDSGRLDYGDHTVRSQASLNNILSQTSQTVSFKVGTRSIKKVLPGDLNKDGRVNIVDFSILLFWWGKTMPKALEVADINQDKKVDLKDLSIMLFYWTG